MDFKSDALEFGTVIHLVLGEYYHGQLIKDELTLKDILQSFEEYWRSKAEDIRFTESGLYRPYTTVLVAANRRLAGHRHPGHPW